MISHPQHKNRLAGEKSPYLLQHSQNPIDWYPWSDEAINKAKDEDKPIFLSIGYATCHWCHVMEKESFESQAIADLMNDAFICIKVDREEMPEVDSLYMEFAQSMMSGSAGWPLNMILTPELKPFFASTYLPPVSRPGMMGLTDLIERITEVWSSEERPKVISQASRMVDVFSDNIHTHGEDLPSKDDVEHLADLFYKLSDPVWGGLKGSPKFPIGYQSLFLLRYFKSSKDARSLFLVERTLDMMQRGGIYDHIGGGFSRYSVDEEWFQPHFEKMIYDNALLVDAYQEVYLTTKKPFYRNVVEETLDYILEEMTSPEGGFYSAEDADSEGVEGLFYTWEKQEIISVLGPEIGEIFCLYYDVTDEGNFEGRNILNIGLRVPEFAEEHDLDPDTLEKELRECRRKLHRVREKRVRPFKDDKILSGWNGLMIHSMAQAGVALGEPRYVKAASRAARLIYNKLWVDGSLLRRYRDHESKHTAALDEYAYMIRALLTLFEIGEGTHWLSWALELNQILDDKFKLEEGAYYQTDGQDPNLILRKCLYSDTAEPAGNSIQCENLIRLWHLSFDELYLKGAEEVLKASKKFIDNYPPGYAYQMMNLSRFYQSDSPTLIIAFNENNDSEELIKNILFRECIPLKAVIFKRIGDTILSKLLPNMESYIPLHGKTTLYICRRGVCEQPLVEEFEFQEAILKLAQTI